MSILRGAFLAVCAALMVSANVVPQHDHVVEHHGVKRRDPLIRRPMPVSRAREALPGMEVEAKDKEGCMNICKHITVDQIPGCSLTGKGCECILDKKVADHTKYKVFLQDPVSGASAWSGYWGDKTTAGEYAVFNLFNVDQGCNCYSNSSIHLGPCTFSGRACFFFPVFQDIANKAPAFNVYAQVVAPVTSPSYHAVAPNATEAGFEAAGLSLVTQILTSYPQCLPTSMEDMKREDAVAVLAAPFIDQMAKKATALPAIKKLW